MSLPYGEYGCQLQRLRLAPIDVHTSMTMTVTSKQGLLQGGGGGGGGGGGQTEHREVWGAIE